MATKNETPVAEKTDNKNPDTLTLRSSDGQEFLISKSAAVSSVVIKNMLEDGCCSLGVIPLTLVDGETLARVITYLNKLADDGLSYEEKVMFDVEFLDEDEMQVMFDVASAAMYLNVQELQDLVCQKIANRMENKSAKWVRKMFGIENDFTPEEEEKIKKRHAWAWRGVDRDDED